MNLDALFAGNGIKGVPTTPGRHYTTCPHCSSNCSSKANRTRKVLGINIKADGSVNWGCNRCGWTGPEKGNSGNGQAASEITYDYQDASGGGVFQKVRTYKNGNKTFWVRRPNGHGGWINGAAGVDTKLIYRLPEINEAMESGYMIAVAEGEKDCDNLWRMGIPATSNAGGARKPGQNPKWYSEHSE